MAFSILMGVPEMEALWNSLLTKNRDGSANKDEQELYKKWGKALAFLSENPMHPSLRSHDIDELTQRYGIKVFQSYLENKKSGAKRMYWVYGPKQGEITIIGLEPHPEDKKNGAYDRIPLSNLPEIQEQ